MTHGFVKRYLSFSLRTILVVVRLALQFLRFRRERQTQLVPCTFRDKNSGHGRCVRACKWPVLRFRVPAAVTQWSFHSWSHHLKGCGMGPWLVLVSPCFRENVVATCKIGSFLCSLDYLLQKNAIVFFFGNQISKWRSFEKRAIFDLLFTFVSHQGKVTKIPSAHISLTYVFCSPCWLFCLINFDKNTNLSGMVSLWYDSCCWFLFAPFWNNQ